MLLPVRVIVDDNGKYGWCVYDADSMCIVDDFGEYQTVMECEDAIRCYLDEL